MGQLDQRGRVGVGEVLLGDLDPHHVPLVGVAERTVADEEVLGVAGLELGARARPGPDTDGPAMRCTPPGVGR